MSQFDYNTAEKQNSFGTIPNGTIVPIQMMIRCKHGDMPGMGANDSGMFKQTKDGDAYMIDVEYTVVAGEYAKQKGWEFICAKGNGSDGHNTWENIAKSKIRAILESANNIDPDDASEDAIAKRQITGYDDLQNTIFVARVGIESQDGYDDKNTFTPVTPDDDEYQVPPKGSAQAAAPKKEAAKKPAAPSWD